MEIQENKAVVVSNIAPSANEKTVSDFFSFCGKIVKLFMKQEEGKDTFVATVQFETESAAKTALLLSNALIVDRPIVVSPYGQTVAATPSTETATPKSEDLGTPVEPSKITQREFNVPDEQRTKTSVIASMLAAGYVLTNDAFAKAKEVDEKHNLTLQAKVAVEQVKVKAHEIDRQYGISEKVLAVEKLFVDAAKQLDQQLGLSEGAAVAANITGNLLRASAQTASTKIEEASKNPTISKGVGTIKQTAETVINKVETTYNEVRTETQKAIEEKQKERGVPAPTDSTTTTTTTTTSDNNSTEPTTPATTEPSQEPPKN